METWSYSHGALHHSIFFGPSPALLSPREYEDSFESPECGWDPNTGASTVDVDAVDPERFPCYAKAEFTKAFMETGDCLFIPQGWYHQVNSISRNLAVNVWWDHLAEFDEEDCHGKERVPSGFSSCLVPTILKTYRAFDCGLNPSLSIVPPGVLRGRLPAKYSVSLCNQWKQFRYAKVGLVPLRSLPVPCSPLVLTPHRAVAFRQRRSHFCQREHRSYVVCRLFSAEGRRV